MIGEKIGGVAETSVCKGRGQRLMQNVCDLEAWGGTASDSSVSSEPSAEWRCLDDCNHRNPEAKPVRRWLQIWNLQVLQFNHLPLVPVLFLNELMRVAQHVVEQHPTIITPQVFNDFRITAPLAGIKKQQQTKKKLQEQEPTHLSLPVCARTFFF